MSETQKVPATGTEIEVLQRIIEVTQQLYDLTPRMSEILSDFSDRLQEQAIYETDEYVRAGILPSDPREMDQIIEGVADVVHRASKD